MKIKSILIEHAKGTLEFEDLEIPTLAMLDPWLNGGVSAKIKAKGLSLDNGAVPQEPEKAEVVVPEPRPVHGKRRQTGMLLHMLQFLARSGDTPRGISEIKADLSRHGFHTLRSADYGLSQAEDQGYVTLTAKGHYKLTNKGRARAADPRNNARGGPKPVTHVHAGEGVIEQKK